MKVIPRFIELSFYHENSSHPADSDEDKYPESLPRYFIENFTRRGATIFDPFMGHGTTAFVAEELGRVPYGIEADQNRYEWAAGQLEHWQNIKYDDAANITAHKFPKIDLCITSPPYMPNHHKWNPLYRGDPKFAGYDKYLKRMEEIFATIKTIMKKCGIVIVQCDSLMGRSYTPLVHDFHTLLSRHYKCIGETIVKWSNSTLDETHTHCLVFRP